MTPAISKNFKKDVTNAEDNEKKSIPVRIWRGGVVYLQTLSSIWTSFSQINSNWSLLPFALRGKDLLVVPHYLPTHWNFFFNSDSFKDSLFICDRTSETFAFPVRVACSLINRRFPTNGTEIDSKMSDIKLNVCSWQSVMIF